MCIVYGHFVKINIIYRTPGATYKHLIWFQMPPAHTRKTLHRPVAGGAKLRQKWTQEREID